ncbi:GerAB/ArcD/ProY family transporter [Paenibacillus polymyxa]|uniref:GerAB/ArcD/ProY family transporter n=2 Tax=Paenibacillus polymyxa TaxID=1406 RepID=UPI002023F115|nr:GerAB/ArcD/ProY family transporter [Paenibacillus polymyxa]MDU8676027.1 GerAB/ArcD/ProY family transporter [Paenibacillus polymyxa]MDU8700937.1 GerAB/ArcD/ProY family transporter [Paenibacillus polymyxa]URJ57864.3 GerAB/ArcD/ProY family transporter [Paenibacillus polymyxa]URJ67359.3 GerAB/ArcD/ProY family transporter [Paenibacillus polymyxa]URJ72359.1 GerAB/ArcD/ProY family transporter [Paenibacillus polymyxa]
MRKNTIRVSELIICMSLFEVGSTTLFLMGAEAKQDAWLVMLIGALAGLLLLMLHLAIHHQDPDLDLFMLFRRYTGKYVGTIINLLFVMYFTYEASRNIRDLGEVTVMTLLRQTPLWIIILITIVVVSNTVRYGYKALFLFCLFLFPFFVLGYAIISILIPATGLFHLENSLPVLEEGWKPIFKAAIPELISFPFGQTVLFLVFYPLVHKDRNITKPVFFAYIMTALALTFVNQLDIFVLGPKIAANSTLPLLETVQLIELADLFERMDALFTLLLFLGLIIKMSLFFNGAVIGLEKITGVGFKKWILPLAALIYGLSFLSPNYIHHMVIGRKFVLNSWFPIFQIFLPLSLFTFIVIKKEKRQINSPLHKDTVVQYSEVMPLSQQLHHTR